MKFRFKLYSTFLISVIVPTMAMGILFTFFYHVTVMRQEERNVDYVLKSVSQSMETQFTYLKMIGETYYMQNEVFQVAEALNNPKMYEYYDNTVKNRMATNYSVSLVKMMYRSKQKIHAVVFFPIQDENQTAYLVDKNHTGIQEVDMPDYRNEEWFQQAIEANGASVFYSVHMPEYLQENNAKPVYSCVCAIRNMDYGKIIGVVKIDADIEKLEKIVDVIGNNRKDNVVIFREGEVLVSSRDISGEEMRNLEDGFRYLNRRIYYVKTVTIPDTDWQVAYLLCMQPFFKSCILLIVSTCLITLSAVFVAFLIYRRHSGETVDDMEHITKVLREIQTGNLDVQAEVKSGNELHDIATAVNLMIRNLKEYIDKEYIWVIRQQRAEYKALQAQINPHFLYNTLNGFIALNRMGETKKLEKSIISLTHLFRYICNKNDVTTIEKECYFLEEYLKLEKVKYEEKLEYMIWIDEECKEKKIPKLLLQPIVENSIVHGMGDTDDPIMITVMARMVETKGIGKVMVISVRDNGVGFDRKALDNGEEHIGIDNVRIRAELYCTDVIYQCISTPGGGTSTNFVFAREAEEDLV